MEPATTKLTGVEVLVERGVARSRAAAWRAVRLGYVPGRVALRIGRTVRVNVAALDAWIAEGSPAATAGGVS